MTENCQAGGPGMTSHSDVGGIFNPDSDPENRQEGVGVAMGISLPHRVRVVEQA